MPSVTTTIEDSSPLIAYSANWRAGSSKNDNLADSYSQSSFTLTQTHGATMSFAFYGSSVTVFGARRQNHGSYLAQLDNNPASPSSGQSTSSLFNQVLFSSTAALGHHNLTITNNDNNFFDVDYVTFESSVGQDDEDLIVNTFKDTHPAFTYNPRSSWTTPTNIGLFMGGSGHATADPSAVAMFTFQGKLDSVSKRKNQSLNDECDAVALYGPVGPNCSMTYSVQVDNGQPSLFSANKAFYRPQQVLYFVGNLGSGKHSLKIQTAAAAIQDEFAIDYATVYTTRSLGGSFLDTGSTKTISQTPPGAVAGLAFTTTVAIFTTLLSIFLLIRQRHEISISSLLRYRRKPGVGLNSQGPGFSQTSLTGPSSLERAESARSARSANDDEVNSQRSSQISSRAPTSFTVPVSMSMTMTTTSNARTQSHRRWSVIRPFSESDIYASSSVDAAVSHPDVPVSVSNGSVNFESEIGSHSQGTNQHQQSSRSEKRRLNPTGSFVQQNYDHPNSAGSVSYVGIQLPENINDAAMSPTATIVPPPEYTQNLKGFNFDPALHVANQ